MKINRRSLLDLLTKVKPGIAEKEIVEHFSSFLFLNGRVTAYNDEILISHPGYEGIEGGVQAGELYSLLSKLSDEEIMIETTDTEMIIKGSAVEAGLLLQAEIPEKLRSAVGELIIDHDWKFLPEGFLQVLHQVTFAVGKDMTKPVLTCVHITSQYAEACDNYRIARVSFSKRIRIKDLLLPGVSIDSFASFTPLQYAIGVGWVHFKNADGVQFSCRIMEGPYPDLGKLLKVDGTVIEFPEDILGALDRSGVFLDDLVMGNDICSIRLSENLLEISAKGLSGWFKERLGMEYNGESVEFQVLPKPLQSILKRHPSAVIGPRSILFKGDGFSYCCSIVQSEKK